MKYQIASDIIAETTKCGKNLSCLSGKIDCLCDVADIVEDKILLIKPGKINETCEYHVPFAFSEVCSCPTRKELYRQYHI